MAEHDRHVADTQRTGRADVLQVARAQEFGAHHAHQRCPTEKHKEEDQQPETSPQNREHDDDHIERRGGGPDLNDPLEDEVKPATKEALHCPCNHPDDGGKAGHDQGEQDRQAEAVDHPRHHIALGAIGAQPVLLIWRQRGRAGAVHSCVVGVGNDRPDGPTLLDRLALNHAILRVFDVPFGIIKAEVEATGNNQTLHLRVAVDGFGLEIAAELGFSVEVEDRHVVFAAVVHQDRFVVRHKLSQQRDAKEHRKDPKAPIGAPVAFEVPPAALVERGERHQPSLRSKSILGSTSTYIRSDRIPTRRPMRPKMKSVPKTMG